jgi:type VI secretion system protein ImpK
MSVEEQVAVQERKALPAGQAVPLERDAAMSTFETVERLDDDPALAFQLRGHSLNPMIDAAAPLMALAMRVRSLDEFDGVEGLHAQVNNQILAIREEVRAMHYNAASVAAFIYCLCTYIDEAVMGTRWGQQSIWPRQSMLITHYKEGRGGEKLYTVMSRMMMEPAEYQHVLEFMYLCIASGFKGVYVAREERQALLKRLHAVLRPLREPASEWPADASLNVAPRNYRLGWLWPWWSPWIIAGVLLFGIFQLYTSSLDRVTGQTVQALRTVLDDARVRPGSIPGTQSEESPSAPLPGQ